jgi:LPS-assembly protein
MASLAFTSQLPAAPSGGAAASPLASQEVTIRAHEQEKQGDVYQLDGDVEVLFQGYVMRAEHVTYHEDTGAMEATGRVVFDGGPHDAHITAGHATYNVKDESGTFYDVIGTFGAVVRGGAVVLTTNNPFLIVGKVVHKVGRDRYVVTHGSVTSCAEQTPTWTFNAEKIDVLAGEDAKLYHSTFRLLKLPIFYFPYTQTPASAMARTTGFLLPSIGESNTRGFIFGDSFYWAINRSSDLTLGAEYLSKRGWSETLQYRVRPTENSSLELHYYGVTDRGIDVVETLQNGTQTTIHQDQGGQEARLLGSSDRDHWRASANIDYLSSFLFRQAFSATYSQAVNSEVRSVLYLSHNLDGISLNAFAQRYQNFYQDPSTNTYSDQIKIYHLPMVEANGLERRLYGSPFYWAVDSSAGGLQRSEPGFVTANLVGRLDVRPRIALPLHWKGWDLRPEIALHDTLYTQQVSASATNPLGVANGNELNRRDVEGAVELRPPVLEKVFDKEIFGRKFKHVIEPILTYRYTTGVDRFQNVIRFDGMDILSDTSEFEYDVVQRIYGRRRSTHHDPGCEQVVATPPPTAAHPLPRRENQPPFYIPGVSAVRPKCEDEGKTTRELLSWEVKQKYYYNQNFGGALVPGRRNVFTDTIDLSGIAFLDSPRLWSPVVSKLRIQTSANTDVQWQLDYDSLRGRINSSATFAEYRIGEYFLGGSHSYFHVPANSVTETFAKEPLVFNQVRALVGYGHPNKRGFAGGASVGYDENLNYLQYVAVQTSYNSDCCGVSFEYRHTNVSGVLPVENQYRFAFTLANIGTFGNMKRQEKLY